MKRSGRALAGVAIALGAVIAPDASAAPDPLATRSVVADEDVTTRWFRCTLGGEPCGRMVETTESIADGGERTRTELLLRFVRQGTTTSATVRTEIETDSAGRLRCMTLEQAFGAEPVRTEWIFDAEGVLEKRRQGPRSIENRLPRPSGEWHLPGAAFEIARRTATETTPATLRVVDPARGLDPVEVTYRPDGRESVVVGGAVISADRWRVEEPDGTVAIEIVDADGGTIASRTSMGEGLGDLEIVLVDRPTAEAAAEGRVELLEAGLVRPTFDGPMRRLDRGIRARYRLRLPEGVEWPDQIGGQVVTARTDEVVEVDVEVGRGSPVEVDAIERHLAPTAAIDADDPDVLAFARRADRPTRPTDQRAAMLRRAVNRHITRKGLSTAFATAGETVRQRAGDCTEHAVLLAAALRAVGIPSRTVSGLVWVPQAGDREGAFLWHMWTQAAVDERWVDLDATLPNGPGFHPGHVAVSVSDGSPRDIEAAGRAMLSVFGAIEIEVMPATGSNRDPQEGDA